MIMRVIEKRFSIVLFLIGLAISSQAAESASSGRQIISLDGTWEIAEGGMDQAPEKFDRAIAVPGLIDMARPSFTEVGTPKSGEFRKAFWYRRSFTLAEPIPASVRLKIHKAQYGARVYLNGKPVGEHLPCFTPGEFDIRGFLNPAGQANELLVRVGAHRNILPEGMPDGADFEKAQYIPGIYDSVELILSGLPRLVNVQTAPDIENKTVRVVAEIEGCGESAVTVTCRVREAASGREVGNAVTKIATTGKTILADMRVTIENCRLWSPEDPFLYVAEISTGSDDLRVRFGMRSFRLDPQTGFAMLNGQRYFLRGSNVCIQRFFEDPPRGDLPWNDEWVRKLHRTFKGMNWNSLRYCIGFPPEKWYEIADEEGVLIQDEFPIWCGGRELATLSSESLIAEYTEWMREHWNHPCVVIWDAQNETFAGDKTGKAIRAVRHLDLSNRPWDNGWSPPQAAGDVYEAHPYLFSYLGFRFCDFADLPGSPGAPGGPPGPAFINSGRNPVILNEYGWGHIDRAGRPFPGQNAFYEQFPGFNDTDQSRQEYRARSLAAESEFWRARRKLAGLMQFCGLCYSKPDTPQIVTSDHFTDIEKLVLEPHFKHYVGDAFAPVGVMVDFWELQLPVGKPRTVPVAITNDLNRPWSGKVVLRLMRDRKVLSEQSQACRMDAFGAKKIEFTMPVPNDSGRYEIVGQLIEDGGEKVESIREFAAVAADEFHEEISRNRPVTASSCVTVDGVNYPAEAAVDGYAWTRWSSEFSDPQWISIDLGKPERISKVELVWEAASAKKYSIEISFDGREWKEVVGTDMGKGGIENFRFAPVEARYVRMHGIERKTKVGGYSLYEFRVFR